MEKTYDYKIYRKGTYVGVLPYSITDFNYTQEINSAGAEIEITFGVGMDAAGIEVEVDYLVTPDGDYIVDPDGNRIITRREYMFEKIPMDTGDSIDVYMYYDGAPNGKRVFSGLISSWASNEDEQTMTITALSWGVQLDNYMIEILPGSTILNALTYNTNDFIYGYTNDGIDSSRFAHQTFQVAAPVSVSSITLILNIDPAATESIFAGLQLYAGTPTGSSTKIGGGNRYVTTTTAGPVKFTLTAPVDLTTGVTYYWQLNIASDPKKFMYIGRSTTSTIPTGQAISYSYVSGFSYPTGDYAFSLQTATGSIGNQFNSYDPGNIIVELLSSFTDAGGVVDCDSTSVSATGTVVSYTFKYSTVLEGIKKCLELAPANWYWYVDVGTNILHFHRFRLNPDHTFVVGTTIETLELKYSLENIKNKVYFSGGEVSGVNLLEVGSNLGSIEKYGQWLLKESDSRVTDESTAEIIVQNILGQHSKPRFYTTVDVLATNYDIETLNLGEMVTFRNSNQLTNSLILQIVSMNRTPYKATLQLDQLPPSQAHRIEDIKRNLDEIQTLNNPAQ